MGQTRPLFVYLPFFSHDKYSTNLTTNDKNVDGVLGTRAWSARMVGADESTMHLFVKNGDHSNDVSSLSNFVNPVTQALVFSLSSVMWQVWSSKPSLRAV